MPIILSQRIDTVSEYKDIPFVLYHYPKRYRNQVNTGDIFIYYQGDRSKKENRYYFGYGVIGQIDISDDGEDYYAHVVEGAPFPRRVPIYNPTGGFYESLDYETVRLKATPSWQSSARKVSVHAYNKILKDAGIVNDDMISTVSKIETISPQNDPLKTLSFFNGKYKDLEPIKRATIINKHLDRGRGITEALKKILGAKCQICNWEGFIKKNGEKYIEAHHLSHLSFNKANSLCSDNVILLCPNCHRQIHYAKNNEVTDLDTQIKIVIGGKEAIIPKNTMKHLSQLQCSQLQ